MLGWSINLFRIRGIQLALHFTFVLLIGYVGWEAWQSAGATSLRTHLIVSAWGVAYILLAYTCVTLHELGHAFTARRFGVNVPRILLLPIGGVAEFDSIPRQPRSEILIALAGPAVNFVLIGLLMIVTRFPANWDPMDFPLNVPELLRHLVVVNAVMGTFNLVPVFPMDGGRVFRALLATRLPYLRATRIAAIVGKLLAVAASAAAIYYEAYLIGVLFLFIFVAGELELRAVKAAERGAAHWRRRGGFFMPPVFAPTTVVNHLGAIVLEVDRLAKNYGPRQVLAGVSFSVAAGERVALTGPSGSGKTTLLNCLGGVDRPDQGGISLHGERIDLLDGDGLARLRRERIGTVFQFFHLLPTLTAAENIELPLQLLNLSAEERRERVAALLARIGLDHRAGALPSQLSGGEQQRIAIARALASRPALILADEPTGNLDSSNGANILALLRELTDETGTALVLVTHSEEAAAICHRRIHLRDGRIVDAG